MLSSILQIFITIFSSHINFIICYFFLIIISSLLAMNDVHFQFFFMYVIELHNLKTEDRLYEADPIDDRRKQYEVEKTSQIQQKQKKIEYKQTTYNLASIGFDCQYCGKTFKYGGTFSTHLINVHGMKKEDVFYQCKNCQKVMETQKQFTRHRCK